MAIKPQSLAPGSGLKQSRHVIVSAFKPGKGFGSVPKQIQDSSNLRRSNEKEEKKVVQEAAAATTSRPKARPIRPEEASRGKLDYVQVADWGSGERDKLGELRLVSHVPQYEGSGGTNSSGGSESDANGKEPVIRPFHLQLAHQLQLAEARGALAVAGPPPPPLSEWSFREGRYVQYLADQLEVHTALEAALREAAAATPQDTSTGEGPSHSSATPVARPSAASNPSAAAVPLAQGPAPATTVPRQGAMLALSHLAPGRLGLERSGALQRDLAALRASTGRPEAVAESTTATGTGGTAAAERTAAEALGGTAGAMARSYGQYLRRLGREAAGGENDKERQSCALRLVAHAAVLHLVGQAAGVRLGATATERLALLPRRAAATYHEYPAHVKDPRVTLAAALDAAGAHLRAPAARQLVFDEVPGAMQKTGLLMSALAHRD